MRRQSRTMAGLAVLLLLVAVFFGVTYWQRGTERVIARATSPDGIEMRLVQEPHADGKRFSTRFLYRKPGGKWNWFYCDHRDTFWETSRVVLDTNAKAAVFYRGEIRAVTFEWEKEMYVLRR